VEKIMISRLLEVLYYIALPLIGTWAFIKLVGKSVALIGVLLVLLGLITGVGSVFEYILSGTLTMLKYGAVELCMGLAFYFFGLVLTITDYVEGNESVLDRFVNKFIKKIQQS
jgi:hypothetical protein